MLFRSTSLTANVGTNAHNIYEIAITTAILIGRFRIANLPNFFSNFAKKLKLNFPHFHFAYQFDIIPYIHKKSNRHARILRLWQSLFSYTSIPFSPICFYDCFSFSGGIRFLRIASMSKNTSRPPSNAGNGNKFMTPKFADSRIPILRNCAITINTPYDLLSL